MEKGAGLLRLELRVGESVKIGDAVLTLEDKSGKTARFNIEAPEAVPIHRIERPTTAQIAAKTGIGNR